MKNLLSFFFGFIFFLPIGLTQDTLTICVQDVNGMNMEQVEIEFSGDVTPIELDNFSNGCAKYIVPDSTGTFTMELRKNINPANGVSICDFINLRKAILGFIEEATLSQWIGIDVAGNYGIAEIDAVFLAEIILGADEIIPNYKSWRFFDLAMHDPDTIINGLNNNYTLLPSEEGKMELNTPLNSNQQINWFGVKIGDFDGSADPQNIQTSGVETRGDELEFLIEEKMFEQGDTITVDFYASNFNEIAGYQMGFEFDTSIIDFFQYTPNVSFFLFEDYYSEEGLLSIMWSDDFLYPRTFTEQDKLFSLDFIAKENGLLSEVFVLSSILTPPIATSDSCIHQDILLAYYDELPTNISTTPTLESIQLNVKPNVIQSHAIVEFSLLKDSYVKLEIINAQGKRIDILRNEWISEGVIESEINIEKYNLTQGLYFLKLSVNEKSAIKKIIFLPPSR